MKKASFIACLLISALVMPGIAAAQPVEFGYAFKPIVEINTYISGLDGYLTLAQSGTGIIVDPRGVVLTNNHVASVRGDYGGTDVEASYQICLTVRLDSGPDCSFAGKMIAKDEGSDMALLQMYPVEGLSGVSEFPYLDIATVDSIGVNDDAYALGYPSIGGGTISLTRGIVSGKQVKYGKNWIKIDAVTSYGSSGGAVIDDNGTLIGITTEVYSDLAGSLGYAISAFSVAGWVKANEYSIPKESPLYQRVVAFTQKQGHDKSNTFTFSGGTFSLTKPPDWQFSYPQEDRLSVSNPNDGDGGYVSVNLERDDFPVDASYINLELEKVTVDAGLAAITTITKDESVKLGSSGIQAKHLQTMSAKGLTDAYYVPNQDVSALIYYSYGKNDKDKETVDGIIGSLTMAPRTAPAVLDTYVGKRPVFSLKTDANWLIRKLDSGKKPVELYHKGFDAVAVVNVEKKTETMKGYTNEGLINLKESSLNNIISAAKANNFGIAIESKNAHYKVSGALSDVVKMVVSFSNLTSGKIIGRDAIYMFSSPTDYFTVTLYQRGDDAALASSQAASFEGVLSTFSFTATPSKASSSASAVAPAAQPAEAAASAVPTAPEKAPAAGKPSSSGVSAPLPAPTSFLGRVMGRILLQVQSAGEAWFVHPKTGLRYYMQNGDVAYQMMRKFGLGITNADLDKIPVAADTGEMKSLPAACSANGLGYKVRGQILLQVQSAGEAWYVDPSTCRRVYMKDGAAAYSIMRYLGLGITNADLDKIKAGE